MAFASRQTTWDQPLNGTPYMKIHGAVYHRLGGLRSAPGTNPAYSQLYLLDADQALENRLNSIYNRNNNQIDSEIMKNLDAMLRESNCYVQIYRHMNDILTEEESNYGSSRYKMYIDRNPRFINDNNYSRLYNLPQG